MKLCKNHCPNTDRLLPEQMKRSLYQNTARISPSDTSISATDTVNAYEQPFPGYEDDFLYFTHIYPVSVRRYVVPVRSAFDKLEYNGSFLFDQYPDREALLRIADDLLSEDAGDRDLLVMLMLHELMHRRQRYRSTRNKF